jgi:hypothetical protein
LQFIVEILVFSAHLMCMNVAAGGPLVGIWLDWRSRRGDPLAVSAGRYLAAASLAAFVIGSLLGLLLGWLLWTPEYANLWLGPLGYKLKWGVLELAFSALVLVVIWLWRAKAEQGRGRLGRSLLALLTSTNLLYHFPVLFVIAGRLADERYARDVVLRGAAFREMMFARETPAIAVHFTLASLAMAGVLLIGYALRLARQGREKSEADRVAIWGAGWTFAASLAQLPVGLWVLFALPTRMQNSLMGNDTVATIFFLASLLAAFWLLRELAGIVLGDTDRKSLIRAMVALIVVVLLMTAMHQWARRSTAAIARQTLARQSLSLRGILDA